MTFLRKSRLIHVLIVASFVTTIICETDMHFLRKSRLIHILIVDNFVTTTV